MKNVCVAHNTGLGDHIFMSGAVRYIARHFEKTFILCLQKKIDHVSFLYRDNPNIVPMVMPNSRKSSQRYKAADFTYAKIKKEFNSLEKIYGFQYNKSRWKRWSRRNVSFVNMQYDAIDVPREERFKSFYLERDRLAEAKLFDKISPPVNYSFACADWSRGNIRNAKIFDKNSTVFSSLKTPRIFDWLTIIEKSKKIYTVDTSFFHLIKSMRFSQQKYYINARRTPATGEDYINSDFDYGWKMIHKLD